MHPTFASRLKPKNLLDGIFAENKPIVGANAFALPGGDIVVTDALVKLVGEGDGLTGVLAHEAGHVEYRHGLRQVIQSSAIGATAALLFGDVSTILSGVPAALLTLLQDDWLLFESSGVC